MRSKKDKRKTRNMIKNNEKNALRNINALGEGDRTYCGKYGIITCTKHACAKQPRKFKVAKSTALRNGGNWTRKNLRRAING